MIMGGTVAQTIRMPSGELIKMARKTGAYNHLFFSKEFNEGNLSQAIEDYVKIWAQMREDFLSGPPYKYPMSGVYGRHVYTSPEDYGLVVIDFEKNKIHSLQGYDTPGTLSCSSISSFTVRDPQERLTLDFLISNNLLNVVEVKEQKINVLGSIRDIFGDNVDLQKLEKINTLKFQRNLSASFFNQRLMPKKLESFEYKIYDEEPRGVIELAKNLVSDKFVFSKEEQNLWIQAFSDFDLDYFYDEEALDAPEGLSEEQFEEKAKSVKSVMAQELLLVFTA